MALETFISKDEEVMKLNLNLYQLMNFRESNSVGPRKKTITENSLVTGNIEKDINLF